ncbi:hypothetical protein [Flavobacterium sp. CF136]|uniref:hypothetical protein n=1 Tax=Flavobacterium sp. (strain CF136) TaxID=1144313 RepID=UPI0002719F1B|nr:hypothetical protein [Flavobacterium sp. CF136]EJL66313.1 hypothetical protein PMI10_00661 [Flavobacterium sp. CF136]
MGNINPQYNDRVQYILKNKDLGDLITIEPVGWTDDDKEYSRHEQYHGIFPKFSNSLKFVKDASEYIQLILDLYGIMAEIELVRNEKHPQTDVWTLTYSGFLDLSTWSRENKQVSVKFNSGGLEQELKARESENVEVDRLTTINDTAIPELNTIDVELEGRRIFLQTKFGINPTENSVFLRNTSSDGNTRGCTIPVPLKKVAFSHDNAHEPIPDSRVGDNSWERHNNGEVDILFFAVSDKRRDLKLKLKLQFTVNIVSFDDVEGFGFWARIVTYKDGGDFVFKENRMLFFKHDFVELDGNTFSIDFEDTISLLAGESLGLVFDQNANFINTSSQTLEISVDNINCDLNVDEDSFEEKSTTKAILAHELADRLVTICTNKKNVFYSDYFGRTDLGYAVDGPGAFIGFTHGFWVRKFDKLPIPKEETPTQNKVTNLFKPLTTSFKDFVISNEAVLNIGVGIEKIGNIERVRIEEKSFFYNNNVTIKLPNQVKSVKRTIAIDKYYSAIEVGYEKGGNYEEAFGLDEFNVKSNFSTIISKLKNIFTEVSKYRADSYGMEFARRKPKSINDTEDTSYDEDIFFLDLKRGLSSLFVQRKWQDDFEKEPTGIFSPETATNLRLSPVNCLLRHGWWISASVIKYATNKLKFGSSTANRQLKTQLIGGHEYAENDDIINSELKNARFIPEEIEFEHVCDFDVMQQVNGVSVILGKRIINLYGLVEFVNEENEIEKGFLMNLKPNGKGSWRVLKANR